MAFSILVCIKAVPDPESGHELTIHGRWVDESAIDWCMNRYDTHALEAALAIKDAYPDVTVDALSAGPDHVRAMIRRAMAMGADAGIHLPMEMTGRIEAGSIAAAIASCARHKAYDLILTGAISDDLMQGITGPMIASALDRPCAVAAVDVVPDLQDQSITVTCEMEGGMAEIVRLSCPALITVQTGRQIPRYPTLSNTLRSRRQTIERVTPRKSHRRTPPAETLGVAFPQRAATCRFIHGTMVQKADALLQLFNDKGWLK